MFAIEEAALSDWLVVNHSAKTKAVGQVVSSDGDGKFSAVGDEFDTLGVLRDPVALAASLNEKQRIVKKQKYVEAEMKLARIEIGKKETSKRKKGELQEVLDNLARMQMKLDKQKRNLA